MISLYRLASENCITPKILETIAINNTVVSAYYLNKETVTVKDAVKKIKCLLFCRILFLLSLVLQ